MRGWVVLGTLVLAMLAPASASAGQGTTEPFNHPCTDKGSYLFCPTTTLNDRVPAFDGVPIDVDVFLPKTGKAPYPTIVMTNAWGTNKTIYECAASNGTCTAAQLYPPDLKVPIIVGYTAQYWATQGYAAVSISSRGWGRSCGFAATRTPAAACKNGFIHLDDQRYDARDVQYLLGKLADQGIVSPKRIGSTGISLGGGMAAMLAYLRNRIRDTNGSFRPWTSPKGKAMQIAAAYPRWAFWNIANALVPNGAYLDTKPKQIFSFDRPIGIMKQSYDEALEAFGVFRGNPAPASEPQWDISTWLNILDEGEPYGAKVRAIEDLLFQYHGAGALVRKFHPAPMIWENGWDDDLFPPNQGLSLQLYEQSRSNPSPFNLLIGDLGHPRGQNKLNEDTAFNMQGQRWMDTYVKGTRRPGPPTQVTAFTQTCPSTVPAGGPYQASNWWNLHPGAWTFGSSATQTVDDVPGNQQTAALLSPVNPKAAACNTFPTAKSPGTAVYQRKSTGFTMLGLTTIKAKIRTQGPYGQLDMRLWDVPPTGQQTLITRGEYRLAPNQTGTVLMQLNGNAYKMPSSHTFKLEVLGQDSPYMRASNGTFNVKLSNVQIEIPTLQKPSTKFDIHRPVLERKPVTPPKPRPRPHPFAGAN